MANLEINQYQIERFVFGDSDYYDIDYWNGTDFETAKILGSTIKAGIIASANLNLKADLVGGVVPSSQLPSFVDDVLEFANFASFPVVGELGKIYIALDTNLQFRWSGAIYIQLSASSVAWGAITGTLSAQLDLQSALNAKFDNPAGLVTDYLNGLGNPIPFPTSLPIGGGQVFLETAIGSAVTTLVYTAIQNIILGAGTWLIEITGECTHGTNNTSTFIAMGVGGVYENGTGRENKTALAGAYNNFSTQKIITIASLQTISLMAKVPSGTGTIRNRVITALKLS